MMTIRKADDRGHADLGWLRSHHTFSFADYHDPAHMGFGPLRVINDDTVAGGGGFPAHPHRDMEILSYVLSGGLAHEDSMGTGSVIAAGDVQRMRAGTGVVHSEQNASAGEAVNFLQIWIVPERRGLQPGYEQKHFSDADKRGRLALIASRDGAAGSITVAQDVRLFASIVGAGDRVEHALAPARQAWLQVARGSVRVNGTALGAGDGLAVSDVERVTIESDAEGEVLLFDLAK